MKSNTKHGQDFSLLVLKGLIFILENVHVLYVLSLFSISSFNLSMLPAHFPNFQEVRKLAALAVGAIGRRRGDDLQPGQLGLYAVSGFHDLKGQ